MQCIDAFDHDPDYVGNGWVGALVYTASGEEGEVNLLCGDELSGVIHIAHPASTGSVHPVYPDTEYGFGACFEQTITRGKSSVQPDGRVRYVMYNLTSRVTSTAIVDGQRRFTYTLFTDSAPQGDNWLGCSALGEQEDLNATNS
ncbi:hypothetical protein GCM10027597_18610 [Saccharopolyspora tripterygii]